MRSWATISRWVASGTLTVALAFAPVASAFASCGSEKTQPAKSQMSGMAATKQLPCDKPCNDCAPNISKKGCGDCVCVATAIVMSPFAVFARVYAEGVEPHDFTPPLALSRPPDTPPPKSLA